MVELLPARFEGPPKFGCKFFLGLFFFFFSLFPFLLHLARGCVKKPYFYRFFLHTLLKHLVTSCSNNELNLNCPKKRCTFFFGGNPFFDHFFSKTLILHHPLKTVHEKISPNPYFYRLKKKPARLLTLRRPGY